YHSISGALYLFFFSSRRRHTRFSRDWSSDVCSSDLDEHAGGDRVEPLGVETADQAAEVDLDALDLVDAEFLEDDAGQLGRLAGQLAGLVGEAVGGLVGEADGDRAGLPGLLQRPAAGALPFRIRRG